MSAQLNMDNNVSKSKSSYKLVKGFSDHEQTFKRLLRNTIGYFSDQG